jgi:catechol 2,3-dioxygenase-like lactoylglutathione lyase family enzyme
LRAAGLSMIAVAVTLASAGPAVAEPRLSPVRRTTIMTAAPDASLVFWRDTLGFAVEYDQTVTDAGQLALISPGAKRGRAIALRQGDRLGGSIGLYWTDNLRPMAAACEPAGRAGATAVLILTDDLGALRVRLKQAGVAFVTDPVTYNQSRGPTDAFTVFDPNCVRVAFAQIARETLEQSIAK